MHSKITTKRANALHQIEFKNITKSQPLANLFFIKSINIDDRTYELLEKKYVSYREFPASTNAFFRVFYVEVFKFLISQFNQLSNFKKIMENICCFDHMKECQVTCTYQHDKNALIGILEKIIKTIFGDFEICDPKIGFENFLEAVAKDEEIDKFGILLIRGNLYKRSFSNATDEVTQAIDKSKKVFQTAVKNFADPCDTDPFYQTIAAILFDIRMHRYDLKPKGMIPPGKVTPDQKKVKIKVLWSPKIICVLEKDQKIIPQDLHQVPQSKQSEMVTEIPIENAKKQMDEEVKINRSEPRENGPVMKRHSFEIEGENGDGMAADGCCYCGSHDLLPTQSICGNCYNRCHLCWTDAASLSRFACGHALCYICMNQIFIMVDDFVPTTCPSCQGLG